MNEERDRLEFVIKPVFAQMKKLSPKPAACPNDETLATFLRGSLTREEREGIEEHLVLCRVCAETLISASEVESLYSAAEEDFTTVEMVERAKGLVRPRERTNLWKWVSSWFSVLRPAPIAIAATAIIVAAVFGIYNPFSPRESTLEISPAISVIAKVAPSIVTRGASSEYREVEIENGGVLHSGDMIKIKFTLEEESYVYLIALGSLGNLTRLLPEKGTTLPASIKPQGTYTFPEEDIWVKLDDNIGQERLYLIASRKPIRNVDEKIDQLKASGIERMSKIFPGAKIQSFSFRHES